MYRLGLSLNCHAVCQSICNVLKTKICCACKPCCHVICKQKKFLKPKKPVKLSPNAIKILKQSFFWYSAGVMLRC